MYRTMAVPPWRCEGENPAHSTAAEAGDGLVPASRDSGGAGARVSGRLAGAPGAAPSREQAHQLIEGLRHSPVSNVEMQGRQPVQGGPLLVESPELLLAAQERPQPGQLLATAPDPLEGLVDPDRDSGALHDGAVLGDAEGAAAARDDGASRLGGRLREGTALELAEVGLSLLDEDPEDPGSLRPLDRGVEILERPDEPFREHAA